MNKLENVLDESLLHTASGDRKALRLLLKKVIPDRFHYYHESRAITRQEEYADLLYKILLLELDEEEEESIELAELAYLGISECILSTPAHIYECLKKRIILMHYFADYFTDSLIEVFLKKYRVKVNIEPVSLYCIYSCSVISNRFQVQYLFSSYPLSITALQKIYLFPFSQEHHTRAFYIYAR